MMSLFIVISKEHSIHIKLSDGERLMSIERTVAKYLALKFTHLLKKHFLTRPNTPEYSQYVYTHLTVVDSYSAISAYCTRLCRHWHNLAHAHCK